MKGIGRRELRSGTSRLVPRGTFSTSHWPRGLRDRVFSSHTAAGTTTKGFRVPMCCGPSFSARRSTSDSRALASATVQMRVGCGRLIGHIPAIGSEVSKINRRLWGMLQPNDGGVLADILSDAQKCYAANSIRSNSSGRDQRATCDCCSTKPKSSSLHTSSVSSKRETNARWDWLTFR